MVSRGSAGGSGVSSGLLILVFVVGLSLGDHHSIYEGICQSDIYVLGYVLLSLCIGTL